MIMETKAMKPMPFLCARCQANPTWYRRGRLVVMGWSCDSIALDYDAPMLEH